MSKQITRAEKRRQNNVCVEATMMLSREDHRGLLDDESDTIHDGYCSGAEVERQTEFIILVCRIPTIQLKLQDNTVLYEELCALFLQWYDPNRIIQMVMSKDLIQLISEYAAEIDIKCLDFLNASKRGCSTNGSRYCGTGESRLQVRSAELLTDANMKREKKWARHKIKQWLPKFARPNHKITIIYRS